MTPQLWIAITSLIAGLQGEPAAGDAQAGAAEPQANVALYGPPAPADIDNDTAPTDSAAGAEAREPARGAGAAPSSGSAPGDLAADPKASPAANAKEAAAGENPSDSGEDAEPRRIAQADDDSSGDGELSADQVVQGVQAFYEDTDHLTALFRQVYTNQTFGRESVSDGRVWLKKPGKMRWDYQNRRTREVNKSFISDGDRLWAIEHDNEQAFRKDLDETVLPVAVTFLTGDGQLARDFDASLDDSGEYGSPGDYVLELTPKQPTTHYRTLWLVVDPDNFRAKQSIVLEASGNTNHFRFFEPNTERPIQSSWFEVDEDALKSEYRIIEPGDQ